MKEIHELLSKIDFVIDKEIFVEKQEIRKPFSYRQREKEYYAKEIDNLFLKVKKSFPDFRELEEVSKLLEKKNHENLFKAREILFSILSTIEAKEKQDHEAFTFVLPSLPKEIESEIKKNFSEAEVCLKHGCYRSVMMLCAKILEIAFHRKYFELTNRDLLEEAPGIGLGNLIRRVKEKGIELDPGLSNQISLINQLRIHSVHKRQKLFEPSKNQALATILYTLDTLKRLFG
ncbi:MAG: hypothetical protein QXG83_02375 [Candidatus Pacearchaeota archaeon]